MYEIFTLKRAWDNIEISEIRKKLENKESFFNYNKLEEKDVRIKKLMKRCLVHETEKRAAIEEIEEMILIILQNENSIEKTRKDEGKGIFFD